MIGSYFVTWPRLDQLPVLLSGKTSDLFLGFRRGDTTEFSFSGLDDVQSLSVVHLPLDLFGLLRRAVS